MDGELLETGGVPGSRGAEGAGEALIDDISINPCSFLVVEIFPAERFYKVLILLFPISQTQSNKRMSLIVF